MVSQRRLAPAFLVAFLAACGGSGGSSDNTPPPPLPAAVQISKTPNQSVYGSGDTIEISTLVLDAAGKTMPNVTVNLESVPPADQRNGNQFVYLNDGTYTITATVQGATQGNVPVKASIDAVVDGHGPTIACSSPVDGAMVSITPGATVTLSGSVNDVHGVTALTVNGTDVVIGGAGAFSAPITTVFGTNFVDLASTDGAGRQSRRTCSFMVANSFAAENTLLSDTLSFKISQLAADDNNASVVNSLADFLRAIANSNALTSTVNNAMVAANPLKPLSCDASAGVCVLESAVTYTGLSMPGPRTASLGFVANGMTSTSNVGSVVLNLHVTGDILGISFPAVDGTVTIASVSVSVVFDSILSGGRPRIAIRPNSISVQADQPTLSSDFDSLNPTVKGKVADLANGIVSDTVSNAVKIFISSNFSSALDGLVSSLDVANLGSSFSVPRLDGTGSIPVSFGLGFSSLSPTNIRMLTGISTRFTVPPAQARPSLGAPLPAGSRLIDHPAGPATNTAVDVSLYDQVLHALWRGGYFDATLNGGMLGGIVPAGVAITLVPNLPPAANLRNDGRFEIALGAVNLHVEHPGLTGSPFDGSVGARVSCAVLLSGQRLQLSNCTVDELHLSTGEIVPDAPTQAALEDLLRSVLGSILPTAGNQALPALPLPSFRVPSSLGSFGLPVGATFGLINPTLSLSGTHFVVSGAFGRQ